MTVTIKDVAKEAGVSISTVSRVINNSKPVSNEIRQKVLEVIKRTGYVPNPVARSLVTKKSQTIGVIVPDMSNLFIGELINGIEEVGRIYNYDILLCNSYGTEEEEFRYINLLKSKQVAGLVFVSWNMTEKQVRAIEESNIKAVYISKNAKDFDVYSVGVNHFDASYETTKHLLEKGLRKILFIRSSIENTIADSERFKGYKKALKEYDIEVDKDYVKQGDMTSTCGYNIMKNVLEKYTPEAVFATNDELAIGVMNAILDKGLDIPKDISVVGYDDTRIASLTRPKLTTVKQPIYDIGAVCIRMLVKVLAGEDIKQKRVELPYQLILRDSVIDNKK